MHVAGLWSQSSPILAKRSGFPNVSPSAIEANTSEISPSTNVAMMDADGEIIDAETIGPNEEEQNPLFDFFDDSDGRIRLIDTRLKAETVKESRIRATLLALRYNELKYGQSSLTKEALIGIMKEANWYDPNYYGDLKDRIFLIEPSPDQYRLSRRGKERAREILGELLNPDIPEYSVPQVREGRKTKDKDPGSSSVGPSPRKKGPTGNGKPEITSLLKEWDRSATAQSYKPVVFTTQTKLDVILLSLYVIRSVRDTDEPVSREVLSSFIKAAFGITYSGRSIADLVANESGKLTVAYERGKGYTLRNAGEERVRELLQPEQGAKS
jgi:hypothetical protein